MKVNKNILKSTILLGFSVAKEVEMLKFLLLK